MAASSRFGVGRARAPEPMGHGGPHFVLDNLARVVSNPLMETKSHRLIVSLIASIALGGCATSGAGGVGGTGGVKPILYENDHYREVGVEAAEMDKAGCMYVADNRVPRESAAGDTAKKTLMGAAGGAALGAVIGAVAGNAGTGAAIGAAGGGTAGLLKGAYDSTKPDETWQGYVEACLRDKGYEVIGWR